MDYYWPTIFVEKSIEDMAPLAVMFLVESRRACQGRLGEAEKIDITLKGKAVDPRQRSEICV